MPYLFTSESVSEGHPDKVADQISDALIDHFLAFDPQSKVACETLVTTGQVVLAGEVKSNVYLDVQQIARDVINRIGYTKGEYQFDGNSCGVLSAIHEQSDDINRGVDKATKEALAAAVLFPLPPPDVKQKSGEPGRALRKEFGKEAGAKVPGEAPECLLPHSRRIWGLINLNFNFRFTILGFRFSDACKVL